MRVERARARTRGIPCGRVNGIGLALHIGRIELPCQASVPVDIEPALAAIDGIEAVVCREVRDQIVRDSDARVDRGVGFDVQPLPRFSRCR